MTTTATKTTLVAIYAALLAGVFVSTSFGGSASAQQLIEYGSDRHGSDIPGADVQLEEDDGPLACVSACILMVTQIAGRGPSSGPDTSKATHMHIAS
jgi:hypothetical protein